MKEPLRYTSIKNIFVLFLFGIVLLSLEVKSQLVVTATGGNAGPTSYTNLKGAFDAINSGVHQGTININVVSNTTETATASLNASGNGSASYASVNIKPAAGTTPSITGSISSGPIIWLKGANNVTIDGSNISGGTTRNLTISNTSASSSNVLGIGSVGTVPINNVAIKNTTLINGTNTSTAVIMGDGNIIGNPGYFSNITFQNNSIQKAYIGLYVYAVVSALNNNVKVIGNDINTTGANAIRLVAIYCQGINGLEIKDNNIGNFEAISPEFDRAIWLATATKNATISGNTISGLSYNGTSSYAPIGINISSGISNSNISVYGNTVSGLTSSGTGTAMGIFSYSAMSGVNIYGNKISNIKNTNTSGYGAAGIVLAPTINNSETKVYNNFVWDVTGYGLNGYESNDNGNGIVIDGGGGMDIDFNTVVLNTDQTLTGAHRASCLLISSKVTSSGTINLRNNILANLQTVGNANSRLAIANLAGNSVFNINNWNDYYTTSTNLSSSGTNASITNTLAQLQASLGDNANSINIKPEFSSVNDLHLITAQLGLRGIAIAGITKDIDDEPRNASYPYRGADEYAQVVIPSANGILYVKKNGAGNFTGNSWANAIPELADALVAAKSNTNIKEIWVAKGTYKPMYTPEDGKNFSPNPADPRDKAFLMVANVKLYGGFGGTETAIAQRNFPASGDARSGTILSGDLDNNDPLTADGETLTITGNNAYHVLIGANIISNKNNTVLNGFTITGGNANGSADITVNTKAFGQSMGGGMHNDTGNMRLEQVRFSKNAASHLGGGMLNYNSAVDLKNVVFTTNNTSTQGGGLYNYNSAINLLNVLFTGNSAASQGGGLYNNGSTITLTNNTITGNTSASGSELYNLSGTVKANNSIIFGSSNPIFNGGTIDAHNSLVWGINSTANDNINAQDIMLGDLFNNPSTADYRLKIGSKALNVGSNNLYEAADGDTNNNSLGTDKDLENNTRLKGGTIDLGVYELQNELPVIITSAGAANFVYPNQETIDPAITASDIDNSTLAAATITITDFIAGDVLAFNNNSAIFGNISGTYTNGKLNLSSAGATATLAQWQAALRTVSFTTLGSLSTGTRNISFTINDGSSNSSTAFKTISLSSSTASGLNCDAATSQTQSTNSLICIGCNVSTPSGAVDNNKETYSKLNMTVAALGAHVEQTLIFPTISEPGDEVTLLLEGPIGLTPSTIYGAIRLSSLNGLTSNGDEVTLADATLTKKIIGNMIEVKFKPTSIFDRIKLQLDGGLIGTLDELKIYYASRMVAPPLVPAVNTCAGTTATLVANVPNNVSVKWFDAAENGIELGSGNTFITPIINTNQTFYAQAQRTSSSCVNPARTPVSVGLFAPLSITQDPTMQTISVGNNGYFSVIANGGATTSYQWQVNTGNGFTDIVDDAIYSNSNTSTLTITNAPWAINGYLYRCTVTGCGTLNTAAALLTVNKLPQSITAADQAKTYGDTDFAPSFTASSGLSVSYTSTDNTVAEAYQDATDANKWKLKLKKAGTVSITASQPGNNIYSAAPNVTFSLVIAPKAVAITTNSTSTFSKIYDGTLNGSIQTTDLAFAPGAILGNDVVNIVLNSSSALYDSKNAGNNRTVTIALSNITLAGAQAANYVISNTTNLTANASIKPKPLAITANDFIKVYNGTAYAAGNGVSYNGFVTGDNETDLQGSLNFGGTAIGAKNIGTYTIIPSGYSATNYFITYQNGTLSISPAQLTIAAIGSDKTYDGSSVALVTLSHNGITGDDLIANYGSANFNNGNVGNNKNVMVTGITLLGASAGNYTFNASTNTTANIIPKALTIAAQPKTKIYGDADPTLTYSSNGLLGTDAISGSLSRAAGQNVGNYAITQGSLTAGGNYNINYTSANLTIDKAPLLVQAKNASKCFGEANPTLLFTYTGFKLNDNSNSLDIKPTAQTIAQTSSTPGNYVISLTGGLSSNYAFSYTDAILRIDALPVLAISPSKIGDLGRGAKLQLTASGGTQYSWANAEGIISGQYTATLSLRPSKTTTYTVTATNANGCSSVASYTVNVVDDFSLLTANNLVTPNGDGINDVWNVDNIDMYPQATVRIFDRAGRLLFTKKGYDNTWDGTLNGQALAESTYYYIIDSGNGPTTKGYITLVRNR